MITAQYNFFKSRLFSYHRLNPLNLYYNAILCYELFEYSTSTSKRIHAAHYAYSTGVFLYETLGSQNFVDTASNETVYNTSLRNFIVILHFIEHIFNTARHIHMVVTTITFQEFISFIFWLDFISLSVRTL